MDEFFQTLRKIQKKERNNATLARVEETFYQDIHEYLDKLRKAIGNDLFAEEYNLIKDTRRVATEICERREHKITDAAVMNIHRSYHLFTGKPKLDLVDTTPLNLTPEEEEFYFSLMDVLKNHRNNISLVDFTNEDDKPKDDEVNKTLSIEVKEPKKVKEPKNEISKEVRKDETLDHLDKISNAKVITDEKVEPIEKQIHKQDDEEFKAIYGDENEFVDLDSQKRAKDSENVNLLIFDEIGAIVGVDEKIYGPFYPQDIVVMPKINARIFVKNRKGRILKI